MYTANARAVISHLQLVVADTVWIGLTAINGDRQDSNHKTRDMAFLTQRILAALWPHPPVYGTLDSRQEPEPVILPAAPVPGAAVKPPVRIYLGTELAQYRAERVFIWSIEQVRDPTRLYEIYLMKELEGFDRRRWLTGFTNYRFAIPDYAGRQGRAIYNDEDQIYLKDPALLFDTDMNGHGYLSISDNDTSVMLLDCARMAPVWNLDTARSGRKHRLQGHALQRGLRGTLDGGWNARDDEYRPGSSGLIHYTALHTQPWRPFPALFAYQDRAEGEVWHELERSADAAGFQIFSAASPSRNFQRLARCLHTSGAAGAPPVPSSCLQQELVQPEHPGEEKPLTITLGGTNDETHLALCSLADEVPARTQADTIQCVDILEYLPDEDIPWVVAELFKRARRRIIIAVQTQPRMLQLDEQPLEARPRTPDWWTWMVEQGARHHPQLHWKLLVYNPQGNTLVRVREGGRLGRPPRVWVLYDHKPGHTTQTLGLVDALGWSYESWPLQFRWPAYLHRGIARLLGWLEASPVGLAPASLASLRPPWPDVIIAAGWRPSRIARWLVRSNRRSRAVLLGRKGATIPAGDDILISCRHFLLPSHPRRIETDIPPNRITATLLEQANRRWQAMFEDGARPRIGLLVGGSTELHRFDEEHADQLGRSMQSFAAARGGSIYAITSRRTGESATRALQRALGPQANVHTWRAGDKDDPYLGFLAIPEILVVTGDSESMIAEALSTGKPVYIYRVPERPAGPRRRTAAWVLRRARARPLNRRGTVRPQQGLEYLCARLLERNVVQPPRDLAAMYDALVGAGAARYFVDADSDTAWRPTTRININVAMARQVRALLGITDD